MRPRLHFREAIASYHRRARTSRNPSRGPITNANNNRRLPQTQTIFFSYEGALLEKSFYIIPRNDALQPKLKSASRRDLSLRRQGYRFERGFNRASSRFQPVRKS